MSDNIHVAIRIRPLIKREIELNAKVLWNTKNSTVIYQNNCPTIEYCFDRVFNSNEGNAFVYSNLCAPIVKSVMEGFNGTIFAYGQTSSGKTYTMSGTYGIVPSAINDIFDTIDNMPEREFLLRVSYMEIYNENIIDLLSDNKNLKTMEDTDGVISIFGLYEQEVKSSEDIFSIMKKGERRRRVGDTQMNEKSSRSHAIFRMIIESRMRNSDGNDVTVGQLNLVDLAGSERSGQMGLTGERFKEGTKINKSLTTLTNVISQLSKGDRQYVSYRDSKLTRILQNSLGGNARTVIICTVTPASLQETQSTLNFASRAKRIKNKPTANIISNDKALLRRYTNEIKSLTEKLELLQQQGNNCKEETLEKELEEKEKQNENLKRQIAELKEKFVVSQFTPEKSGLVRNRINRRETWGGGIHGRKPASVDFKFPLPVLREETSDSSPFSDEMKFKDSFSSFVSPSFSDCDIFTGKSVDVSVQTDDISDKKLYKALHKTKQQLNMTMKEFQELKEFTTSEKQFEVFEESFLSRTRSEDFDSKYDILLAENTKQKAEIQEMSQQIIDLKKKIYNFEMNQKIQNSLNDPSAVNKSQISQLKELADVGTQVLNTLMPSDIAVQTDPFDFEIDQKIQNSLNDLNTVNKSQISHLKKLADVGTQMLSTEISSNIAVQTEVDPNDSSDCNSQFVFPDNLAAVNSDNINLNSHVLAALNSISSHNNIIKNTMEKYKVLDTALLSIEMYYNQINNKILFDGSDEVGDNLDLKNKDLLKLLDKQVHSKYEQEIKYLKDKIDYLKKDDEQKIAEIQHLKNICTLKDRDLELITKKLETMTEDLLNKESELANWRHQASEKYDLYLASLSQKAELQLKSKELEQKLAQNEKINKIKLAHAESDLIELKNTFNDTLKSFTKCKMELDLEKENFAKAELLLENDKQKLNQELILLKSHVEQYDKIIEELKYNNTQRITALEMRLKKHHAEKIAMLEKDLNNKYNLQLANEIDKLQIEIMMQTNNSRLEKVKFEEESLKLKNLSSKLEKVEKECERLKSLKSEQEKPFPDNMNALKYKKQFDICAEKLQSKEAELKFTQNKLDALEKSLEQLKLERKVDLESIQELDKKKTSLETTLKEKDSLVKQHVSKFSVFKSEFEREYKKLKSENAMMKEMINKFDINLSLENNFSANQSLLEKLKSDAERNIERIELEAKCQKLKEDNNVLYQKLDLCKREIRRLHEENNETKMEKTKNAPVSNSDEVTTTVSDLRTQLLQKEKRILRLEKENKKYQDYLKSKGHHRAAEETAKSLNEKENNEPKLFQIPIETPTSNDNASGSITSQNNSVTEQKLCTDHLKKPTKRFTELNYDNSNCKQQ